MAIIIDKPMPRSCEECFLTKSVTEIDMGASIRYSLDCRGNIIKSGWGRRVDCPLKEAEPEKPRTCPNCGSELHLHCEICDYEEREDP